MFIYKSLHVVNFLPHIGLQVFREPSRFHFYTWAIWPTHTCSARRWRWEYNGNLCWNVSMDASRWYHLPQVIVSPNYDASSRKIFSRWNVQLLDESPLFDTDDVSIGSHILCTIIDWLSHNNVRDEITVWFISFFFKCYLLYVLSFMSFVLSFFIVYVVCIVVLSCSLPFVLPFFLSFLIVCLLFSSNFYHSIAVLCPLPPVLSWKISSRWRVQLLYHSPFSVHCIIYSVSRLYLYAILKRGYILLE